MSVPIPTEAIRRGIAPTGVLRAAINLSNFLLVSGRNTQGVPYGVSPGIAAALADALNVEVELIPFKNPGEVADAANDDVWDIGNIGAEKARAAVIEFSSAYAEIPCTLLVPVGSSISSFAEADQPGVRIAVKDRAAYALWLTENLRHATLVTAPSIDASYDVFVEQGLDALAGLRPRLMMDAQRLEGSTVVDGQFRSVQQAIGVPKGRASEAADYVERFVTHARESGLVAALIDQFDVEGLAVP